MTGLPQPARRILVVDDNPAIHEDFRKVLVRSDDASGLRALEIAMFGASELTPTSDLAYEIVSAHQGADALKLVEAAVLEHRPFLLAFVDMRMPPGLDGLETIERMWRIDPRVQVVICTAYSDHPRDEITRRLGLTHQLLTLKKPFDQAEVEQLASALTEKWLRTRDAELQTAELERLVEERTAALRLSEERFALAARGSNDGLWDWDVRSGSMHLSDRWWEIAADAPSSDATMETWRERVHACDLPEFDLAVHDHLEGVTNLIEHEHRLRGADGGYRWVLCRGVAVRGDNGATRVAGSMSDISRQKATEEELRRGAYYDRLTGLPNRSLVITSVERVRAAGESHAVLFLDFDRFKHVNDSLGHAAGDQLLVDIARRLTSTVRRACADAAGDAPYTVARMGGDEFVVLLERCDQTAHAERVALALLEAFGKPFRVQGAEVFSTASIGVAFARGAQGAPDEALRNADTAMYAAKSGGRSRHAVYDTSMNEGAALKLTLERDLRRAIESGELFVEYQPILSAETSRVMALEALLRWTHPRLGLVSPERFIPIAEETGQIVEIGAWVIRTVCDQIARWRSEYDGLRDVPVSINLSHRQLVHPGLADLLLESLDARELPPGALLVEVTESVMMDDLESSVAVLNRLRRAGIDAYMDDFGTGHSSLSCLKQLPLAGMKLDRSFVVQAERTPDMPAIIHAVVTLARNLRLRVVAEGVENREQLASVLALDCDLVQGFLFARAMRGESVPEWVRLHHELDGARDAA